MLELLADVGDLTAELVESGIALSGLATPLGGLLFGSASSFVGVLVGLAQSLLGLAVGLAPAFLEVAASLGLRLTADLLRRLLGGVDDLVNPLGRLAHRPSQVRRGPCRFGIGRGGTHVH